MSRMTRLWWLPYAVFALLGAPAISIALAAPGASIGFAPLYLAVTVGIPVALVIGIVGSRREADDAGRAADEIAAFRAIAHRWYAIRDKG